MPTQLQFVVPQRRMGYPPSMLMRRRSLGRMRGIGALTPAQAAAVGMPLNTISKTPGFTQAVFNTIVSDVTAGAISEYADSAYQVECSKAPAPSLSGTLTAVGSGLALKIAGMSFVAGPAAPVLIVAGAVLGIFSMILNHHALAVQREQGTLCAAVPAFNTAVQTVVSAVQAGTITPSVGAASLQQVLQDFQTTVQPIMKDSSGSCNAACVMFKDATAIVALYTSQFQDLASSQAANPAVSATGVVSSAAASLGVPAWALYAAAGVGLFLLLGK